MSQTRYNVPIVLRWLPFHYAWVITVVTFFVVLVTAGVRAAPGALLLPLQDEFGWSRASISLAAALSTLIYGLASPLAGILIDRFGPRRIAIGGSALIAVGLLPMTQMTTLWQLMVLWGVLVGIGVGGVGSVLGATVATRWFRINRGMAVGLFSAAGSMGQLIFVPSIVQLNQTAGWRMGIIVLAVAVIAVAIPTLFLLRDRPSDIGIRAYGDDGNAAAVHTERLEDARGMTFREATRTRDFWLLAGSFFVCGFTANGLIGTHLIAHAADHGFSMEVAAGAVGIMGAMNIIGSLSSGWLTDRYDNRKLLAMYYSLRALSIVFLPLLMTAPELFGFAILYGLDWIATVPPTTNLTARIFGRANMGVIYGSILCSHMVGASLGAFLGGAVHDALGDYTATFLAGAMLGVVAAALALRISTSGHDRHLEAVAIDAEVVQAS